MQVVRSGTQTVIVAKSAGQRPVNFGVRFSMKAVRPSV